MRNRNHRTNGSRAKKGQVPHNRNHVFESNGPDSRVRGTAQQLFEKYTQFARSASSAGDKIKAESFYQYAEHYARILAEINEALQNAQKEKAERQRNSETKRDQRKDQSQNEEDQQQDNKKIDFIEDDIEIIEKEPISSPTIEDEKKSNEDEKISEVQPSKPKVKTVRSRVKRTYVSRKKKDLEDTSSEEN